MKRIKKLIILLLIIVLPVIINAGTYETEVGKANSFLNKENFINSKDKYIVQGNNIKFEYFEGVNKTNSSFTKGGFISMSEYKLTESKNVSYLFEGIEYWTLTKSENKYYAICYDDINSPKDSSSNYNGRVTEFVNPTVTVHGEGKINNPWTFDPIYKVHAVVDSRYATIESGNDTYVKGGCTSSECTAKIVIREKTGYRYISNDCNGLYDERTKTFTVNNVKQDTTCNVNFGKGIYIITLNGGTPNKIYLKYGENYYKDFELTQIIRKIDSVAPQTGYTFTGYFYNNKKIINGDNESNPDNNKKIRFESVEGEYITSDVTLNPSWEANKYRLSYNCNGGSQGPSSQIVTYDTTYSVSNRLCGREGYVQKGWNTKANGTGETWNTPDHTNKVWKYTSNIELYAIWEQCGAGTCCAPTNCTSEGCSETIPVQSPAGSYCDGGSAHTCPTGYTSEAGSDEITDCYVNCLADTYVPNVGDTCTSCGTGYSHAAETIYYNSTSSACTANTYTFIYISSCNPQQFNANPKSATYNQTFTVNNPVCMGNTFTGWNITGMDNVLHTYGSNTTTNTSINSTKATTFKNLRASSGAVTFTAQWNINDYGLSYQLNGGKWNNGDSHPESVSFGVPFTVNNPTREGYTFDGWNITGMDTITHYYGNNTTTNTSINQTKESNYKNLRETSGTVTFTATWTVISSKLTVNPNGGTWKNSTSTQTITENYGTSIAIPDPSPVPKYRVTYNMGSTGLTISPNPAVLDRTFTGWTPSGVVSGNSYTFGVNDNSITANYASSVQHQLPSLNKTGSDCKWENSNGVAFLPGTYVTVTSNVTYYAVCSTNSYKLTVDPNGGEWNKGTDPQDFYQDFGTTKTIENPSSGPKYIITYNKGEWGNATYENLVPTEVERPFINSDGWTHAGSGSLSTITTKTGYTYTYTFGAGSGTLTARYSNTSVEFTLPKFSLDGHTCKWAEGSTSGTQYAGGATRTVSSNTAYYAMCTPNSYTLTLNPNGGVLSGVSSYTGDYGTTTTVNLNISKGPNYRITYDMGKTGLTAPSSPTTAERILTGWTQVRPFYGVLNGTSFKFGAGNDTLTASYGNGSITLPALSKTGHTCMWENSDSQTFTPGTVVTISKNTTFTAVCTANQYKLTVKPNGGTWNGKTTEQEFTQDYGKTMSIENPSKGAQYRITFEKDKSAESARYSDLIPSSVERAFVTPNTIGWSLTGNGSISKESDSAILYTYGAGNGILTAGYEKESEVFRLPSIELTGNTCYWMDGDKNTYQSEENVSVVADTIFTAYCEANSSSLEVNPNGGTWDGYTSTQTFNGVYGETKSIGQPSSTKTYSITYDIRFVTDISYSFLQPTEATVSLKSPKWIHTGGGSFDTRTNVFTYGETKGFLKANYNTESNAFTLPTITLAGHTCYWVNSKDNTSYACGASTTITEDTTFTADCSTINDYTLTVNPNGGKWNGSSSETKITQKYDTTVVIADPDENAKYKIEYDVENAPIVVEYSNIDPIFVDRPFIKPNPTGWSKSGAGTITGNSNYSTYKYGAGNETITAQYSTISEPFILPSLTSAGRTCTWIANDDNNTAYTPGTTITVNRNTKFTANCDQTNSYTLTVDPNGGMWNGSSSVQTFTQKYESTKTILDPISGPTYALTYDYNRQGATCGSVVSSVARSFIKPNPTGWTLTGSGSITGTTDSSTYIFGAGSGRITAQYKEESNEFALPSCVKKGYTCVWEDANTRGEQYSSGETITVSRDTQFKLTCLVNQYTLTVEPNGGTWNGKTTNQSFKQNYGTTKTIADPSANPTYTITYDVKGLSQNAIYTLKPTSVERQLETEVWSPSGKVVKGTYTYTDQNETITAQYSKTSKEFTLPSLSETGKTCVWDTGKVSYAPGTPITITGNTTFTADCSVINSYNLDIDPNGCSYDGKTDTQTFTQQYGTTKEIYKAEKCPGYNIDYNANNQDASYLAKTNYVERPFSNWIHTGYGSYNQSSSEFTFGEGTGVLTASIDLTSNVFTLPECSKEGYSCQWAKGSASGSTYACGSKTTIDQDTTFYMVCSKNQYSLTVKPNGGTWNGYTTDRIYTQDYATSMDIPDPSPKQTYSISYNVGSTGFRLPTNPAPQTSVERPFDGWTPAGLVINKKYTFQSEDKVITANYNRVSESFTLPACNLEGYSCEWVENDTNSTRHQCNTQTTISRNTIFTLSCLVNKSSVVINPNGGKWNNNSSSQTFEQDYGSTKIIADPTENAKYTISYNMGDTGVSAPSSPKSVERAFIKPSINGWSKTGSGSLTATANSDEVEFTFGSSVGYLTAQYNTTSNSFTLPTVCSTGYTCKWAEGTPEGIQYSGGSSRTITGDTTYYYSRLINQYQLNINPNGCAYNGNKNIQSFTQDYGSTKEINDADNESCPAYTISYNANGQGATYTVTQTSVPRIFGYWVLSGEGSFDQKTGTGTYTYGAGTGTLTAYINEQSYDFNLPAITKEGYTCKWAKGSASGSQYSGTTSIHITENTTFYAVCTANSSSLVVDPNGGTWNNKTSVQEFIQDYATTMNIANPSTNATYKVTYHNLDNTTTSVAINRQFTSWNHTGGGTFNSNSNPKVFTFGTSAGYLQAKYNSTSDEFALPNLTKEGYSCSWRKDSQSGIAYPPNNYVTVTGNTEYYADCSTPDYFTLTVNPSGCTWNESTSSQDFTQEYGSTKTIDNPTNCPGYRISYDANGQGAKFTASPTSVGRPFDSWTLSGKGSFSAGTYTFGAGAGTLTATLNATSNSFTLPNVTKTGYTCKWAEGSTSGTQYAGNTSRNITGDTTYYAICTVNSYKLTVKPNGGTWNGKTTNQSFTQKYNTTKTIVDPTVNAKYTITYDISSIELTGQYGELTPTSADRAFIKPNPSGWTLSGKGTLTGDTESTIYKYGAGAGTITAKYSTTSEQFTLPAIIQIGKTCVWVSNDDNNTSYSPGTIVTVSKDTTFTANCDSANSYTLTVDPNGCEWQGSRESQSFTQLYESTKTINDPTNCRYNISYNMGSSGVSAPSGSSYIYATRALNTPKWNLSGEGTLSGTTYTFGAGAGTLTANPSVNGTLTLPAITNPTGYTCYWKDANSVAHNGGETVTVKADTTFTYDCTINSSSLTVNPNGGTWEGKTTSQTFTQDYGTTKTIANPTKNASYVVTYHYSDKTITENAERALKASPNNWTHTGGGSYNSSTQVFTFGTTVGYLTAQYEENSNEFKLPALTKEGYSCAWRKGSQSGLSYPPNNYTTVNSNTDFYEDCSQPQSFRLTVNPNSCVWHDSVTNNDYTSSQNFDGDYLSTRLINNPSCFYKVNFNANGQGATFDNSSLEATREFVNNTPWTKTGSGTLSGTLYTYGAGNGTLTANPSSTATVVLPSITKEGHSCVWAEGSASGQQYTAGTSRTISANTTYYAICNANQFVLTLDPNGGTLNGTSTYTGAYGSTTTVDLRLQSNATYTISYNMGSTGISAPESPTSAERPFTSWTQSSPFYGTLTGTSYKFGAGNDTITANYDTTASFTLPALSKTGYTCKWAEGSASGTQYAGGTVRRITSNKTYYAICTINKYTLTLDPSEGALSGSGSYEGDYGTTTTINLTVYKTPEYTIGYNMGSTGISQPGSPISVQRELVEWTKSSPFYGSLTGTSYTFGAGNDTLTAKYNTTSVEFTLPNLNKTGYTCKWAEGSASGTQYAGGATRTITSNKTYYAVCTINSYTLEVNPNGGTWESQTTTQSFSGNYNSTKTIADPSVVPTYTIGYEASKGITIGSGAVTSVNRPFTSWILSGSGSFNSSQKKYTYGAGNGMLTANYSTISEDFTLPSLTSLGATCQWQEKNTENYYEPGATVSVNKDTVFTASCTSNMYTLTIDPNGGKWGGYAGGSTRNGTTGSSITVNNPSEGSKYTISYNMGTTGITAPESPTSVERPFTSWTQSSPFYGTLTGTSYKFGTGNDTITANYDTTSNKLVLPSLSKTGHTCQWAEGSSNGTAYNPGFSISVTSNTTFYAVCNPIIYSISLDFQGGSPKDNTVATETIYEKYATGYYLDSATTKKMTTSSNAILTIEKVGYTFGGYYTDTNCGGTKYISNTGYITNNADASHFNSSGKLYACWTPNITSVSLEAGKIDSLGTETIYEKFDNGLYLDNRARTQITTSANPITAPENTGYTFNGYYTDEDGKGIKYINSQGYLASSSLNFDLTIKSLYAYFTPKVLTITLDTQGAGTSSSVPTTTTIYNKYATGLYMDYACTNQITTSTTGVVVPIKTGYTFGGYYTGTNGSGTIMLSSTGKTSRSTNLSYFTDNGTLYAKWTPQTYTITLDNQSADNAGTTKIYEKYATGYYSNSACSTQITTSSNPITVPTRTGYIFGGYYTEVKGGGKQIITSTGYLVSGTNTSLFTSAGTLYAKWTPSTYTLTLTYTATDVSNSLTTTKRIYEQYNTNYCLDLNCSKVMSSRANNITIPTRTNDNWGFAGYYTAESGGTQVINKNGYIVTSVSKTLFSSDTTLYAQWEWLEHEN